MDSVMYQLFKHEILQKKTNLNHIKDIENLEEIVKYWKVKSVFLMLVLRICFVLKNIDNINESENNIA